jgi:hypothetical protein
MYETEFSIIISMINVVNMHTLLVTIIIDRADNL